MKTYGKITVGKGTTMQRDLSVVKFIQSAFTDNRLASVLELENGDFVLMVENPISTNRNPQSLIWLSKESVLALHTTITLFFQKSNENDIFENFVTESATNGNISFSMSENFENETHNP